MQVVSWGKKTLEHSPRLAAHEPQPHFSLERFIVMFDSMNNI